MTFWIGLLLGVGLGIVIGVRLVRVGPGPAIVFRIGPVTPQ